eukprot:scaffold257617_cov14-Tisochrysis_lutea.AAC.1
MAQRSYFPFTGTLTCMLPSRDSEGLVRSLLLPAEVRQAGRAKRWDFRQNRAGLGIGMETKTRNTRKINCS